MASKIQARRPYFALVFLTFTLDRWTKWLIETRLGLSQTIEVIDGFVNITYVRNTGVAFGFLDAVRLPMKPAFLALVTIAAVMGVLVYSLRTPPNQRLLQVALSLVLAGALGNLYDRIRYGYVIDFLEVYFRSYRWPSFNVADSAITTGVALLALQIFRDDSEDASSAA